MLRKSDESELIGMRFVALENAKKNVRYDEWLDESTTVESPDEMDGFAHRRQSIRCHMCGLHTV
jgi:hypothetical protein